MPPSASVECFNNRKSLAMDLLKNYFITESGRNNQVHSGSLSRG